MYSSSVPQTFRTGSQHLIKSNELDLGYRESFHSGFNAISENSDEVESGWKHGVAIIDMLSIVGSKQNGD